MTTAAAVIFMLTSLTLAYVAQDRAGDSLFEGEASEAAAPESPFAEPPQAPGEAPGAFEEVPAPAASPEAAAPPVPEPAPAEKQAPASP